LVPGFGTDGLVVDIPMTRVKMNAKHEYEFIANFKVMQNVFKSKRIEKARLAPSRYYSNIAYLLPSQPIPVEKLVKCKMQCVAFSRLIFLLGVAGASKDVIFFSHAFPCVP
jgi:hypothetical protein